jgi:hypothetical protein
LSYPFATAFLILKQQRRKLIKASSPGQELVSRIRRHIHRILDAYLIEGFVIVLDIAGVLTAAATAEHQLNFLLETRCSSDIIWSNDTAAEETDM